MLVKNTDQCSHGGWWWWLGGSKEQREMRDSCSENTLYILIPKVPLVPLSSKFLFLHALDSPSSRQRYLISYTLI
jgi:hypothetical protein